MIESAKLAGLLHGPLVWLLATLAIYAAATALWRRHGKAPIDPDQKFAAGTYPNENPEMDGLARWVKAERSIDGHDLVLWAVLGFRHVPRAEDWPAMPALWHGFRLRPFNFFDKSPALDVPPK